MENLLCQLVDQFFDTYGIKDKFDRNKLVIDFSAPHHSRPKPLREEIAVYLFFQGENWLKVGYAAYSGRLTSQHYGTNYSSSTFAKDIWLNRVEYGYQGEEGKIGAWLFENFGSANIRYPIGFGPRFGKLLEAYLHLHLDPKFEGRRKPATAG